MKKADEDNNNKINKNNNKQRDNTCKIFKWSNIVSNRLVILKIQVTYICYAVILFI